MAQGMVDGVATFDDVIRKMRLQGQVQLQAEGKPSGPRAAGDPDSVRMGRMIIGWYPAHEVRSFSSCLS